MSGQFYADLSRAAEAIEQKQFDQAQNILMTLLDQDPHNPEIWFLLSQAGADDRGRAICLRNTLALTPNDHRALQQLHQMEQALGFRPLRVMRVGLESAAMGQDCPYCSNPFEVEQAIVVCPKCRRAHHFECWCENMNACAATLCDGFSFREVIPRPLPLQPPRQEEIVVIRREDVPEVKAETRKQKEQRFQRRLLLSALLAEEGELSPEVAASLPSVDELLDQIQQDRSGDKQPSPAAPPPAEPVLPPSQVAPPPYFIPGMVIGFIDVYPKPAHTTTTPLLKVAASCQNCGYVFQNSQGCFCPKCGAARQS